MTPEEIEQLEDRVIAQAYKVHAAYLRDLEAGRRGNIGPGRPLAKGQVEPKMHVNARVEPAKVIEMHEMTGKKASELLVEMHRLLTMAKTGAQATAILGALEGMLAKCDPEN